MSNVKYYVEASSKHFNHYERPIDRKYFVYDVFRYVDARHKIEKYIGSNQVILYLDNKEIYNSDLDTLNLDSFKDLMVEQITLAIEFKELILKIHILDSKGLNTYDDKLEVTT